MKTKHSAGPWNAAVDGWALNLVTHSLPTGHIGNICFMQCSGAKTQEEAMANALLISAAPELLEACKAVCESISRNQAALPNVAGLRTMLDGLNRQCAKAIAKAEGTK